jgi:hypothetical protein
MVVDASVIRGGAVEIGPGVFRPNWSVVTAPASALLTAKAAIAGAADWS